MSATIEALYITDQANGCILEHVYRARPPKAKDLVSCFNAVASPQPAILQLTELNPPTTIYTVHHSKLRIHCTSTVDCSSLAILEFLHRIVDILEDFLGAPLHAVRVQENYAVVAQILAEVCDGGLICNTEPNALRESVEVSTKLGRLFEQVGLPGASPALGPSNLAATLKANSSITNAPAIPWRRSNVRHTSNELYVDLVESLNVIFAPSGRPISARSQGSISFTSKISGVPDLSLLLTAPGGTSSANHAGISRTMQLPVFHPCVRLSRWKERPGELSFIPPDGKFMLAGYEVDLLPSSLDADPVPRESEYLFLPATIDMRMSQQAAFDFEVRLTLNNKFPGMSGSKSKVAGPSARPAASGSSFSFGSSSASGSSAAPTLEGVMVTIPFPLDVKNVTDFKASRGDAIFNIATRTAEWRVPTKDAANVLGTATLTGKIISPTLDVDSDEFGEGEFGQQRSLGGYYDENELNGAPASNSHADGHKSRSQTTRQLMPRSISVSFSVKGWLPSGVKVESLTIDSKNSRGLGEGVRPYKGVKYLTVSRGGVERRL